MILSENHPDILMKAMVAKLNVRLSYLSMGQSWLDIHQNFDYPEQELDILGKVVAGCILLKSQLKAHHHVYMQIQQGFGNIEFMSVQVRPDENSNNKVNLVRALARMGQPSSNDNLFDDDKGRLVVTISSSKEATFQQKYQGIVALDKSQDIAFSLGNYFTQSEQLNTWLKVYVDKTCVKGLLVQAMPNDKDSHTDYELVDSYMQESNLSSWDTQLQLNTAEQMIKDTFYNEELVVFDSESVEFRCTCSNEKIEQIIKTLGEDEVRDIIKEQGKVEIACEFCQRKYKYSEIMAMNLFKFV